MDIQKFEKVERKLKIQESEEFIWVMRLLLSGFSNMNNGIEAIMICEGNFFLFGLENITKVLGRWYLYKKLNKWIKTREAFVKTLKGTQYDVEDTSRLSKFLKLVPPEEYLGVDPRLKKLLNFFNVDIEKFEGWRKKHF